jgi:HD-GYP domain-containing protein (c-di-GMP phosphodiesterase class II)
MTTDRPYRKGIDRQSALAELRREKGKQFDPEIVDAFLAAIQKHIPPQQVKPATLSAAA